MASSASMENLLNFEPWMFKSALADSWISEAFGRDTETLTMALQQSISNNNSDNNLISSPLFDIVNSTVSAPKRRRIAHESFGWDTETLTMDLQQSIYCNNSEILTSDTNLMSAPLIDIVNSTGSGSEDSLTTPKRRRIGAGNGGKKIARRKSRASKRSTTTFITTDSENFRQMVQQVTGLRTGSSEVTAVGPIVKPMPQRPDAGNASPFLVNFDQPPKIRPDASSTAGPSTVVGGGGSRFDALSTFPTLESWKVA